MDDNLIGLIPAAGKGLRLRLPYPKELYPLISENRYKPISQFVLENLTAARVSHIVFVINETKHQLIGYYGDGHRFGCCLSYVVQETHADSNSSTSPGLAHALASANHLVRNKTVLFGMADTIMQPVDVFNQMLSETSPQDDVVMGLFPTLRPYKFGMVAFDQNQRVQYIVDKPKETHLTYMWGCILWRPCFSEHLYQCVENQGISDFATVMNSALQAGMRFRAVCIAGGTYLDLGTYDEILELETHFRAH